MGRSKPPISGAEQRSFETLRDSATLQLLFKASRLANEKAIARVRSDRAAGRLRPAHTALFPHLDFEGVRLTDLAAKAGVSKQAVGQLIDDLAQMGMVERVRDPSDGRAKRIRFSRRGHAALMSGLRIVRQIEGELAVAIGIPRMRTLHNTLHRLVAVLRHDPL